MKSKSTLQDALDNLAKLEVVPSEINIGKEWVNKITEMAKELAFKRILAKKCPPSNPPTK